MTATEQFNQLVKSLRSTQAYAEGNQAKWPGTADAFYEGYLMAMRHAIELAEAHLITANAVAQIQETFQNVEDLNEDGPPAPDPDFSVYAQDQERNR